MKAWQRAGLGSPEGLEMQETGNFCLTAALRAYLKNQDLQAPDMVPIFGSLRIVPDEHDGWWLVRGVSVRVRADKGRLTITQKGLLLYDGPLSEPGLMVAKLLELRAAKIDEEAEARRAW